MPYIVRGNNKFRQDLVEVENIDYKYSNYPDDGKVDLRPGSDTHNKLVDHLLELADTSWASVSPQHARWKELDNILTAFISQDDAERAIKDTDDRIPTSIVLPYSFAILDSLLTYLVVALVQEPILQYEGSGPEDIPGALLLQSIVASQARKSKLALSMHTLFRDCIVYNTGHGVVNWSTKKGWKRKLTDSSLVGASGKLIGGPNRARTESILFEGSSLDNINPYYALPDPNVPASDAKSGDYFGWMDQSSYYSLLTEESSAESTLFNVKYLKHMQSTTSRLMSKDGKSANAALDKQWDSTNNNRPTDILSMFAVLIPKEFKLGDSEYPEKWFFRLAADGVIIQADRLDYDHADFPIVSTSPDSDGRSVKSVSRIEVLYSLQSVGDWLFNSHIANVRKSINNMLVVDPALINLNDLRTPGPGKIIRLRRPAWGRGVDNAIKQLKVEDITSRNIGDAAVLQGVMQMIAGTDNSMMGALRQGGPERLTGKEFEGTRSSAMSRLERLAKIVGLQAIQDVSYMYASNTLQFMSDEGFVKLVGDYDQVIADELGVKRGRVKADFANLEVDYDIIVRDGSIPGGDFNGGWLDVFQTLAATPELANQFDMTRIFLHIARGLGAKNVGEFKKKVGGVGTQMIPDDAATQQATAGNLVPYEV